MAFDKEKMGLVIGIIGAFTGLLGIGVTPFLQNYLSSESWDHQQILLEEQTLLNKRNDLIDKTSQLIGEAPGVDDLWKKYLKQQTSNPGGTPDTALSQKLADYNAQYNSVIALDQMYFGSKTKETITKMSSITGPWWEKGEDNLNNLLAAMVAEIRYGLPKND